MVLQQCRYHHLHACVPVWTQSCSGITKKNHSSARLRLSASKHFRVGSNLLPLVHTCELSTLGLLGQLKKKTLKPKRQWNTTKEQIKSRQVTLPIIACAKAHFFQNFIFSILFFFFFSPPRLWGNELVAQLEQKPFLAVLFLHIHFCYPWMGAQWMKHLRAGTCWWQMTQVVRILCHYATTRKQSPIIRASHYIRVYSVSRTSTFITALKLI